MPQRSFVLLAAFLAAVVCQPRPSAQVAAATATTGTLRPAFEVASVKRNVSGEQNSSIRREPGGRLTARNMPLRALITFAYQIQGFQLIGDLDWISGDRFDIVAKAAGDPPPVMPGSGPDQLMLMMRALLAERFNLRVYRETREMPIYALVLARRDGKPGPQLHPAATDCATEAAAAQAAARSGAPPQAPQGPNAPVRCGVRMTAGRIQFGGFPLTEFARSISNQVQRIVVDRTGLTGNWDFELSYALDPAQGPPGLRAPGEEPPAVDPNAPSLFAALQEQLGLKLDATRGPVEVLVIDRLERPTED
jgi:bla regulator protein blaR1